MVQDETYDFVKLLIAGLVKFRVCAIILFC